MTQAPEQKRNEKTENRPKTKIERIVFIAFFGAYKCLRIILTIPQYHNDRG